MSWNYLIISKLQWLHRWRLGVDKINFIPFHPLLNNTLPVIRISNCCKHMLACGHHRKYIALSLTHTSLTLKLRKCLIFCKCSKRLIRIIYFCILIQSSINFISMDSFHNASNGSVNGMVPGRWWVSYLKQWLLNSPMCIYVTSSPLY